MMWIGRSVVRSIRTSRTFRYVRRLVETKKTPPRTARRLISEILESRTVFAQVTLDFSALPFNTLLGNTVSEDGFTVFNVSGGTLATTAGSSPWTAVQGQTLYNNVGGAPTRVSRSDGGSFSLSSIQLNSLNFGAPAFVPFTYYLVAGGTSSASQTTDGNFSAFQTYPGLSSVVSRIEWQQLNNAGDYHQFDNLVLNIGPRVSLFGAIPAAALYAAMPPIDVTLSDAANLSTFTFADLALTRNGTSVTLNSSVTVSLVSGTTYSLSGLESFTSADGDYVLSVNARNIQTATGLDGMGSLSTSWTKSSPPVVSGVSVAAGAHVVPGLSSVVVSFSEAVSFPLGSQQRPASSASQLLAQGATTSGIYWIDPDGAGGQPAKLVYCDMVTDGGGWMLGLNSLIASEATSNQVASDVGTVSFTAAHNRNLNQYFAGSATAEVLHEIDATNLGQGVFRGKYIADSFEQPFSGFTFLSGHSNNNLLIGSINAPFTSSPYGSSWFWSGSSATTIPSTPSVSSVGPYYVGAAQVLNSYRVWVRGNGTGTPQAFGGAELSSNYELRSSGTDGVFNTVDDVLIVINSVNPSSNSATLGFSGLAPGNYRFRVKDTITNGIGTALDGDGNSTPGGDFVRDFTVLSPPTDIQIASQSFAENQAIGATIGQLVSVDPDVGDAFTYSLVSGTGSTDNSSFTIAGDALKLNAAVDFETKNSFSIRVRSTDAAGLTLEKPLTLSVVDLAEFVAAPTIGDGTTQHSFVDKVVIVFDGQTTIQANAFTVNKRGAGGGSVTTLATPVVNTAGQTVVTLTFSGSFTRGSGVLVDGFYDLTVDGSKILRGGLGLDVNKDGTGGDTYVLGASEADNFFALYGDTSGDGVVGVSEFGQFRTGFGKTSSDAGYNALFDYEMDAVIGVGDFGQFRSRFGKPKLAFV